MSDFAEELKKRHKEQEKRCFGDIYEACVSKGCDLDFVRAFAHRIWLSPVHQTKCFVDSKTRGELDQLRNRSIDKLRQWEIYLSVLVELRPEDAKVKEWKESLSVINYYKKNRGFKDASIFGFWLIRAGESAYTDILLEQNGENSEIINFLDEVYAVIMKNSKSDEEKISKIRSVLSENGFVEQVEQCDKAFIKRYKPTSKANHYKDNV